MRHTLYILVTFITLSLSGLSANAMPLEVHLINGLVEEVVLVKDLQNTRSLDTGMGFKDLGYKHTLFSFGQWVAYIKHPGANQLVFQYLDDGALKGLMAQGGLSSLPAAPARSPFMIEWIMIFLVLGGLALKFRSKGAAKEETVTA